LFASFVVRDNKIDAMIKEAGDEKNFAQIAKITKVKVISLQIQNNKIKRRSQMFQLFF